MDPMSRRRSETLPPLTTIPGKQQLRHRRASVAVNPGDYNTRLPPIGKTPSGRAIQEQQVVGGAGEKPPGTAPVAEKKPEATETKLEDQFTNDKLVKLQAIFQEADEDGGGGLDMEEFRGAMRTTLGDSSLTDNELDMIFMKVDTNCDGTVDLDEYLTYMLLECREKDIMSVEARQPFPRDAISVSADHRDSIIRIQFMPKVTSGGVINDSRGKYLAMSQEGVISFWTPDWKYICSRRVEPTSPKGKSIWVTDLVCMPNTNTIALATTNRDIVFYDISGKRFDRLSRITSLPACCMCIKFYMSTVRGTDSFLVWGDDKGGVTAVKFKVPMMMTLLNPKRSKVGRERFPFEELSEGLLDKVTLIHLPEIHADSVIEISYSHHLSSFISCSKDTETAMVVGDLEQKTMPYYFRITRGINAFEYSKKLNVIATGGFDGIVRVWNPYVTVKPIVLLADHKSPILRVHINAVKEHIISIAENKDIRVHDLNTQTCIQTFYRKMLPDLGCRPVTASFFHPRRQALSFATVGVAVLEQRAEDIKQKAMWSHSTPVTCVRYNPLFRQVVSASQDSMVYVWNVYTGEKVMQFTAHTIHKHGRVIHVEVTSITFDPTFRRLFTALRDGTVKVWNFNNGACLRELPVYDKGREITSIVCPESKIVTAGWNKRLTIYVDDTEDDTTKWLKRVHQDDILSLAMCPPNMIASASYDGQICVWSLDTYRLVMSTRLPGKDEEVSVTDAVWNQHVGGDGRRATRGEGAGEDPMPDMEHRSVEKLVFIKNRDIGPDSANLLAACSDGYVRAYSVHHKGSLLGQFLASSKPGVPLTCAAVTEDSEWLVTADGRGYIRMWDIEKYCLSGKQEPDGELEKDYSAFPCYRVLQRQTVITEEGTFILKGGAPPPVLVNSFRSHLECVTALDLAKIEGETFMVTSSPDCSVRLWTFYGESLGVFGRDVLWCARKTPGGEKLEVGHPGKGVDSRDLTAKNCLIPPDIRRVASAKTLRVWKSGRHPMWALSKNILLWFMRFQIKTKDDDTSTEPSSVDQITGQKPAVPADGGITSSSVASMPGEAEKENVLGKSYKRQTKHRPTPTLEAPLGIIGTQCAAYHYLPAPIHQDQEAQGYDKDILENIRERYNLSAPTDTPGARLKKNLWKATNAMSAFRQDSKTRRRSRKSLSRNKDSVSRVRRGSVMIPADEEDESEAGRGEKSRNASVATVPGEQSSHLGTITEA